ncbi:hypothetical protein GLI01_34370 [Gluconacetobacter liquefaciens]|uniref:Uncharacterized protein n=1 Tax=Gluconacetobacter liquefaciens TaxID=89584 RepID=A0A370GAR1_GLULI|nr:hypothetical protein [Gluconacetobacter liquefaciens]MBB2185366.1 hypothetical protein [Gluconacetobacter liquefaciens]RDI40811.1 hypothetical protein C7453_101610 [Gluconacetobacter liquefaciens]GBR13022.1 hypothetical protein AA0522_2581 [Gluconacetobacter liquefaciens NRIC 0522]GEB39402.1 hypothetical protein GLI01_34370 [Gluconacetobacter liquefaciens]
MRRHDERDHFSEISMLLSEIQSDVEQLNSRAQSMPQTPETLREGIAALADKIDALCDLSRR